MYLVSTKGNSQTTIQAYVLSTLANSTSAWDSPTATTKHISSSIESESSPQNKVQQVVSQRTLLEVRHYIQMAIGILVDIQSSHPVSSHQQCLQLITSLENQVSRIRQYNILSFPDREPETITVKT